jgi:hypothetical protein
MVTLCGDTGFLIKERGEKGSGVFSASRRGETCFAPTLSKRLPTPFVCPVRGKKRCHLSCSECDQAGGGTGVAVAGWRRQPARASLSLRRPASGEAD